MKATALLIALATITATAGAVDVGQHPAVFSPRTLPGIDPSTFIVGHPAGGAPGKAEEATADAPSVSQPAAGRVHLTLQRVSSRTVPSLKATIPAAGL